MILRFKLGAVSVLAATALCCPALAQNSPAASASPPDSACPAPKTITPVVVASYPHDTGAFTQGLIWHDGALFESTGQFGRSDVRRVDLASGRTVKRHALPARHFGEGLARMGDELVALTWHAGVAHRFDAASLKPLGSFRYRGEGWGLAADGTRYIRSDGSATLHFHRASDFAVERTLTVRMNGVPLTNLNELEWIDGRIWANIWFADWIAVINPASGCVERQIDLRDVAIAGRPLDEDSVLNGIAWDQDRRRLFVTGKEWPKLFEIALPPE